MKIVIGCDHGAYVYKETIRDMLKEEGHEMIDVGCYSPASVDYPDIAKALCAKVLSGEADKGIILCGTGIGVSIACNKINGIRCGLCTNTTMAELTRAHNDANVLAMGARIIGIELAKDIVHTFLNTEFSESPRHIQRIEKLAAIEKEQSDR